MGYAVLVFYYVFDLVAARTVFGLQQQTLEATFLVWIHRTFARTDR